MKHTSLFTCVCVLGYLSGTGGCASSGDVASIGSTIEGTLLRQAQAWNRGDLESFMEPYWKSADLTFSSGGTVTRGWESTLDGYRQRYPSRNVMGRLTFSDLEITPLGTRAALVLGHWKLERDDPIGGVFSLVFRRDHGRWVIVHDHTSKEQVDRSAE